MRYCWLVAPVNSTEATNYYDTFQNKKTRHFLLDIANIRLYHYIFCTQ